MKIIHFLFAIPLFLLACTEPTTDSAASTANATTNVVSEKIAQPIAEKIEQKEELPVSEPIAEISEEEKERLAKEEAKAERKRKRDEAYKKASLERKEKRRKARAEKRRLAKEEKERLENEKAAGISEDLPKEDIIVSTPVEEEIDELKMKNPNGTARIVFKETEYDFGLITQGDKIKHDFVFENVGSGDVEILNVDVTCGCTVPTFPFLPIAPGEKGTISVTYNSTGKLGNQKPMITVVTNAKPHTYKIYLKGVVDAERMKPKEESGSN